MHHPLALAHTLPQPSALKPDEFCKVDLIRARDDISSQMQRIMQQAQRPTFLDEVWNAIDNMMILQECDIYSYIPDADSDPFSEDNILWSFNYFIYSKSLKRVVFFTCRSLSKNGFVGPSGAPMVDGDDLMLDADDDVQFEMED